MYWQSGVSLVSFQHNLNLQIYGCVDRLEMERSSFIYFRVVELYLVDFRKRELWVTCCQRVIGLGESLIYLVNTFSSIYQLDTRNLQQ